MSAFFMTAHVNEWRRHQANEKVLENRTKVILDPDFKYTSSANTDIRKTFARARRAARRRQVESQQDPNVVLMLPYLTARG